MDKPSSSTNKTIPRSQLIVFSPDVLKKLGITSQISKLTKTSTSRTLAITTTTTDQCININQEKKPENISVENKFKQQLSQTLNNAIKLKTNKSVEENTDKNIIITSDNNLQLNIDKEIASNSSEIILNSENFKSNQLNLNESNSLLNSDKCVDHVKKSVKNEIITKSVHENELVLGETSIRKSGRKRKISSILENYVTELNDNKETTKKQVKMPENKQKLSKTILNIEKCVDSVKTLPATELLNNVCKISSPEAEEKIISVLDCNLESAENITSTEEAQIIQNEYNDIQNSEKNKEDEENLSIFEISKSVNIENDEKTNNFISKGESATCSTNQSQSSILLIGSIAENETVDQCTETKSLDLNDKSEEFSSVTSESEANNTEENIVESSEDSSKLSLETEVYSSETLDDSQEIQFSGNTTNVIESENDTEEQLFDAEINMKSVGDGHGEFQLDLNSLDPKVATLLKPLKRGRPKGRKIRSSGPLYVDTLFEDEEIEIKAEEEKCLGTGTRRRSGRQRKEKKLEDAIYYDSSSVSISTCSTDELMVNGEIPEGKRRRGRPRKQQVQEVSSTEEMISPRRMGRPSRSKSLNSIEESDEENNIIKSGRRKKINRIESDDDNDDDGDNYDDEEDGNDDDFEMERKMKKSEKGNKRGHADSKFQKWKYKIVECGVCNEKIPNSLWTHHCGKHNYLCWRIGEDPIDLDNRKVCESILLKVALTKKVMFTCEKCGEKRKSAVGYLSHVDFCQKTEEERLAMRVPCPECHKLLQPCSFKIHMRNHLNESSKVTTVGEVNSNQILNEDGAILEGGRAKRNAAKKAQGLINKFTSDDAEFQPVEKEIRCLYKKGSDSGRRMFNQRKYKRKFEEILKKDDLLQCPIQKCSYSGFDLKDLKMHIETCSQLDAEDFVCFACWFITQDESEMEKHVLESHQDIVDSADQEDFIMNDSSIVPAASDDHIDDEQDDDDDDEYDDDDDEVLMRRRKKKSSIVGVNSDYGNRSCADKIKFLSNEVRVSPTRNCTYPAAGKWTNEFCQRNYCLKNLFAEFCADAKDNWKRVPSEEHDKYLPPTRKSISVKSVLASKTVPDLQGSEHDDWKEFQLFETELCHDTLTIFCGGPIWELAWLPTPLNSIVDQILAVSIQRNFNETFKTSESYTSHQIIQFWNFGKLHFKYPLTSASAKLEFCLVHDHGNVWCMEWCPSGCYDDDDDVADHCSWRRMGLLAMACSDGNIPIYSIPFPQINNNNDDQHQLFKPIESCRLIMQDDDVEVKLGNWNYQCTKLNWSKIQGHNKIAAGYSNGMVCLWDLGNNEGPLLKTVDDKGTVVLKPYFSFQPHTATITALHFYEPLMSNANTKMWLFTGSLDRNSYVWDLEDPSTPVFVFTKRGNISDGAYINHWLCSFISFDDVHFIEHTTTSIQNVRDFGYKNSSLLSANSMVMGLSTSDWANAVAQVTLAGELCCTFQRQLLLGYDVDKGSRCKRFLISYCESINKHLNPRKRKKVCEIKTREKRAAANACIPEKFDNNFFRYLMSKKENDTSCLSEDDDDEPDTYEEVADKYGIIFCDIPMDNYDKIPPETLKMVKTSSKMKDAATEMYPILSQNRVRWNPNKQAYIYICSGYHSGFVRLRCVRFMHSKLLTVIK